mmetsp:Transcript_25549/g.49980  ORF Transcript_25549/g.49980 Transcript_25549/m.49980 type:complete len:157 (+) Transcript_25549:2424-2894(+)
MHRKESLALSRASLLASPVAYRCHFLGRHTRKYTHAHTHTQREREREKATKEERNLNGERKHGRNSEKGKTERSRSKLKQRDSQESDKGRTTIQKKKKEAIERRRLAMKYWKERHKLEMGQTEPADPSFLPFHEGQVCMHACKHALVEGTARIVVA